MRDISVIVPTLNEAGNIDELISRIKRVFEKLPDLTYEIIFVDDNSSDFTREKILSDFNNRQDNIRLLHRIEKKVLLQLFMKALKYRREGLLR